MRGGGEQTLAQRHGAVDIDDHGDAAADSLGAEIGAELGASAFGQHRGAVFQQHVGRRQSNLPQFGIAEGDDVAFAGRVDHDRRQRGHQASHMHEVFGVDALMRELVENVAACGLARIAHRSADRGAAAKPHDADRGTERIAAADLLEMGRVLLRSTRRHLWRTEGEVAYGNTNAENAWRDFRRPVVKIHARMVRQVVQAPGSIERDVRWFRAMRSGCSVMHPAPE
jgi:hypothetical protein